MYLLDSNVLIDAKNRYYPFDVCPGFWDWLDRASREGTVTSVGRVYQELVKKDDELAAWVKERRGVFLEPDEATVDAMREAARWVMAREPAYTPAARAEFLSKADYYLVGAALAQKGTVITNEMADPKAKRRVKIPDACDALGVHCTTPFTMLRTEGVRLVAGP